MSVVCVCTHLSPSVFIKFCKCIQLALLSVSLQTAVMVRVDTEENDDDENLSGQSQDQIMKDYDLTSSKHSTTVSGERKCSLRKAWWHFAD